MIRGPRPGASNVDYVSKARAAWGADAPEWVLALARLAEENGQKAAGEAIGYSGSTISELISNKYRGDIARLEQMVRGALMGATVLCPVLGEIGQDQCRHEQARPFVATNSTRAMLRRECRRCPHSQPAKDRS